MNKRHPALTPPRPQRGTPEYAVWTANRNQLLKDTKHERLRGPIVKVAAEEAQRALSAAIAQCPNGLLPIPNIQQAHQVIYQRLESVWVDACAGDYMVVQSKLAVLKLMSHVLGVDASLKASRKQMTQRVTTEQVVEHMSKLGLVRAGAAAEPTTPRVTIDLDQRGEGEAENPLLDASRSAPNPSPVAEIFSRTSSSNQTTE